jgi:hypothetical protein
MKSPKKYKLSRILASRNEFDNEGGYRPVWGENPESFGNLVFSMVGFWNP